MVSCTPPERSAAPSTQDKLLEQPPSSPEAPEFSSLIRTYGTRTKVGRRQRDRPASAMRRWDWCRYQGANDDSAAFIVSAAAAEKVMRLAS